MTEQIEPNTIINWLDEEIKNLPAQLNPLPALKLEPKVVTVFTVDFSKPFDTWKDGETTKAIMPVTHAGQKKVLWLNKRNPLYRDIVEAGKKGITTFSVFTTGDAKSTRYSLIKN